MIVRWFFLSLLLVAACQQQKNISAAQEAVLTNNGKGQYWDLVYSTTALGTINESVLRTRYHKRRTTNVLCDYYAESGKLTHYRHIDSVTVVDAGASDVILNPDKYTLIEDSLRMGGFSYKILVLTPDILALRREWQGGEILRIYVPSHLQNKRVK